MNILLINPYYPYPKKYYKDKVAPAAPPLGLAYIAAVLNKHGHNVDILDMYLLDKNTKDLRKHIERKRPDLVGVSCNLSFTNSSSLRIARCLKDYDETIKVVLGGNHATFLYREILSQNPQVDVIVLHEGEYAFLELVTCLDRDRKSKGFGNLGKIDGVAYRDEENRVEKSPQSRLQNLDELPFPARHLLPMELYGADRGTIITSRGCPFGCSFCSTSAYNGRICRFSDPKRVVGEVEIMVKEYNLKRLSFSDDTFTVNKKRVIEICQQISERGLNVKWGCFARTDTLDEKLLKAMYDAGCDTLFFGIESATQEVQRLIGKNLNLEQARRILILAKEIGFELVESFIIGLPGEMVKTIKNIIGFVKETKPDDVRLNYLKVYPGTNIYNHPEKYGLKILQLNWDEVEDFYPMTEGTMTKEEMIKSYLDIHAELSNLVKGETQFNGTETSAKC
jgi:radical SAM superfamily enzyme YgiQ (UPF0313 family)